MSRATSLSTGQADGVARVLRVWELARSSFYHQRRLAGAGYRAQARGGNYGFIAAAGKTEILD